MSIPLDITITSLTDIGFNRQKSIHCDDDNDKNTQYIRAVNLWASVLLCAVNDIFTKKRTEHSAGLELNKRRALAYILGNKNNLGSFNNICHLLSLNPQCIRDNILFKIKSENIVFQNLPDHLKKHLKS